jgi:hypothetical protein
VGRTSLIPVDCFHPNEEVRVVNPTFTVIHEGVLEVRITKQRSDPGLFLYGVNAGIDGMKTTDWLSDDCDPEIAYRGNNVGELLMWLIIIFVSTIHSEFSMP